MDRTIKLLRCSVIDCGDLHDIEVTFSPESPVRSLIESLPVDTKGHEAFIGPTRLDPDETISTSPLVAGSIISIGAPSEPRPAVPTGAVGVIRVVAGPETGAWCWVPEAGATIGRSTGCDLSINSSLISRQHARIRSASDEQTAEVEDLNSTNGTLIGQLRITEPTTIPDGGTFEIEGRVMQWTRLQRRDHGWQRQPDGHIEFTVRRDPAPSFQASTVELPPPLPESKSTLSTTLLSAGAPVLVGLAMFVATRSASFLLFTLAAPLTMAGQKWLERRTRRRDQAAYDEKRTVAAQRISQAVTDEEAVRRAKDPDELTLRLWAMGGLPGLWSKTVHSADSLTLRVGTRDEPASLEVKGEPWKDFTEPKQRAVPVTVDLRTAGVLGVVGDGADAEGLLRWLILQLAIRRSPRDLHFYVFSSRDGEHLAWTRWLPHLDGEARDAPCDVALDREAREELVERVHDLFEARKREARGPGSGMTFDDVVIVLDGASSLLTLPGLGTVLREGRDYGIYALGLDVTDIQQFRAQVTLDGRGGVEVIAGPGERAERADLELSSAETGEEIARLLAPLQVREASPADVTRIPYPVRFLDMFDIDTVSAADVRRLWQEHPGLTTRVPLGEDEKGIVYIDLARDGPHAILAGTTGAGKSVLLQSFVASLLLHNTSDELNLILIDFKGGGAFKPFTEFPGDTAETRQEAAQMAGREFRCPQVVGFIRSAEDDPATRFDEAAARRVIASLRRELERRTNMLSAYGSELGRYLRERGPEQPPMPRLAMVFDEFARFVEASPEFVHEVVAIAGLGRSLGMHLVISTQSIGGKVSDEALNNVDLRISLRQGSPEHSRDVILGPEAAGIPKRLRGRAYVLRRGEEGARPRQFQSGYLGWPPPTSGVTPARCRLVAWSQVGASRQVEEQAENDEKTDLQLVVEAIDRAGTGLALAPAYRPLLPPLPGRITHADVNGLATAPCPAGAIPYGVVDVPELQAQPVAHLPLDGSVRLMIGGGPQSGRTTAVRALIHGAVARFSPDELHLYVVERSPSGLSDYEDLPHCGGVFEPSAPERIRWFIEWLGAEVARRDAARLRGLLDAPTILALIDGWEHFYDATDALRSDETSLVRTVKEVVKVGPALGVHVVMTCEKSALNRPGDQFDTRLVLPFPQAATQADFAPRGATVPLPLPGRALDAATGHHVQFLIPTQTPAALVAEATTRWGQPTRQPERFLGLPERVTLAELSRPAGVSDTWIVLGVGGPQREVIGIDLFDGPSSLLITGVEGFGRTTAAAMIARQLAAAGVGVLVVCPQRSTLPSLLVGVPRVYPLAGASVEDTTLRDAATGLGTEKVAIVFDDLDQVTIIESSDVFPTAPSLLADACDPANLGRLALVLCGDAATAIDSRRGAFRDAERIRDTGQVILLGPTARMVSRMFGYTLEDDQCKVSNSGRTAHYTSPVQLILS